MGELVVANEISESVIIREIRVKALLDFNSPALSGGRILSGRERC